MLVFVVVVVFMKTRIVIDPALYDYLKIIPVKIHIKQVTS